MGARLKGVWRRYRTALCAATIVFVVGGLSLAVPVSTFVDQPAADQVRVTARTGGVLRVVGGDGRTVPVSLDDVSQVAVKALIATEDRHFYAHRGVHLRSVVAAAVANVRARKIVRGGSTITMQVARALRERRGKGRTRSLKNKLAEAHLALRLDLRLSKPQILELWLNNVSFGNRLYGIQTASEFYFGKSARDLTPLEATFLIGLPKAPSLYNPIRNLPEARSRQRVVLTAAVQAGALPNDTGDLLSMPIRLAQTRAAFRAPHLADQIVAAHRDTLHQIAEVRTTIAPWLQERVESLATSQLKLLSDQGVSNLAALVVDNRSGDILAYLGSTDYWSESALGQNNGVEMLRQPGSTLKPFVYGRAIADGAMTTSTILADLPIQVVEGGGAFSPNNYDGTFHGPTPMRVALGSSFNVPAVQVARTIGPRRVLSTLHDFGFRSLSRPSEHYGPGLALGNGEVQLRELARAYAALARGGSLQPLRSIEWVRLQSGDTLRTEVGPAVPTGFSPEVSYLITHVLKDPEARAPAFGRAGPLELPFPAAVKTGTSKDYRDNVAVGYTPRYTVAVWAGNFDGAPMQQVSGVSGAAPLMRAILLELGSAGEFKQPAGVEFARVCTASGKRPGSACNAKTAQPFIRGTAPVDTCDVHRRVAIGDGVYQVLTVHPPEYHEWMRQSGLAVHGTIDPKLPATGPSDQSQLPTILYPAHGATFAIDPVLNPEFQRLAFKAITPDGTASVEWTVNDTPVAGQLWSLQPGTHAIRIIATRQDGTVVRSRPHTISVVGSS